MSVIGDAVPPVRAGEDESINGEARASLTEHAASDLVACANVCPHTWQRALARSLIASQLVQGLSVSVLPHALQYCASDGFACWQKEQWIEDMTGTCKR